MNTQAPLRSPFDPAGMVVADGARAPERTQIDIAATLREVWAACYRNRMLIVAIVAVFLLLGLIFTMLAPRKYQAVASVQIEQQASKVLDDTSDTQPVEAIQDADRFLQTQADILNSRALQLRVIDSLNLLANDKFLTVMGETPADKPVGVLDMPGTKREQVLKILDKNLSITLPRNSRIVQIGFRSQSPHLAATVANSFATNFIMSNLKRKFDTSAYARTFLSEQLDVAKQRLEEAERQMVAYSRAAGLIDASTGVMGAADAAQGPRSLVTSDLVQINSSYSQAQAARVQAEQRWRDAQHTPVMNLPDVLTNPAVMQLQQVRAQAQAAFDEERQHHKPDYPTMQQAAAQIASLDQQINKLALAIKSSIRDQYQIALSQEKALGSSVNQLKQDTLSEQDRSVQMNILRRQTDQARAMYDALLQRYQQVSAGVGLAANNISLIDVADAPAKPVSPKPLLNLAAAGVLGLLFAGVIVLLREKFDDAVRTPDDVSHKLGINFLASIPLLRNGETPSMALADPRSSMSEAYSALRTSLELVNPAGMPRTLVVTSSRQSEGKSTTAYSIARDFARLGRQVLLIDGDLRKPSLHRVLLTTNSAGFSNVIARHKTVEEVVKQTDTPGLSFISSGPLPPNPAELLSGAMLPTLLRDLGERYDLVVIDGPPVLGLADAVLYSSNTGGTVFVVEANASHHGHAKAAIRRLASNRVEMLGAVLTKYDARKVGYGEEYGYSYYAYSYGRDVGDDTPGRA